MIICSKDEGNGTLREFVLDDTDPRNEVQVRTHLSTERSWVYAGVITRAADGLEAAVADTPGDFVKLKTTFTNEVAALQAIARHYKTPVLN